MATFVLVGRRSILPEHIVLVEPYAPENAGVSVPRDFLARVILLNRDSILVDEPPQSFVDNHGFRFLADDQVAINPMISFHIEQFLPSEGFTPSKPYATRLVWRCLEGNQMSKLLLSDPESVFAVAVVGADDPAYRSRFSRRRRSRKRIAPRGDTQ